MCTPDPNGLWETYKDSLSENCLHRAGCASNNPELKYFYQIHNLALIELEDKCISKNNKSLKDLRVSHQRVKLLHTTQMF